MPHSEVRRLCLDGKLREAIDFASRIKPGPRSGKKDDFIFIGEAVSRMPIGSDRDILATKVIEGLLQLGDLEHSSPLVLLIKSGDLVDKFSRTIEAALRSRQDDLSFRPT